MASTARQIADKVVELLNAGSFTPAISPVVQFLRPSMDQETLGSLNVLVVPGARADAVSSRGSDSKTFSVDIGLLKHIDPEDVDEADELLALIESIGDYLARQNNRTFSIAAGGVAWQGQEQDPIYFEEHLDVHSAFVTVLRVNYVLHT